MRLLLSIILLQASAMVSAGPELPEVLTLEAAIRTGLNANLDMLSQRYRVAGAELDLEQAQQMLKPQIRSFATSDARSGAELGSRYGLVLDKQNASGSSLGVGYYQSSFGDRHLSELRFSYRLPFFGNQGERIRNGLQDTSFSLQHEQNMSQLAEIELKQEISQRFYSVVLSTEQVRLARRMMQLSTQRQQETQIRRDGEQASDLEMTRARINALKAQQQYERSQTRLAEVKNQLCLAMGVNPSAHLIVDDTLDVPPDNGLADLPLPELLEMAYEQRLDFALSRHEISRMQRAIKQEKGSRFPNIDVSLQYAFVSEDDTFGGAHKFGDTRFGVSVKMDTDFSRAGGSVEQRRRLLEYRRRKDSFQRTLDLARVDIQRAQAQVKAAHGDILLAQELTELAEKERERGAIMARGGELDSLDLYDLESRVDEARHQHRAAQISLMNAAYSLRLLLGGIDADTG